MSYCKLTLYGFLTREPELRTTPQGTEVCDFAVAHNVRRTVKGEQKDEVIFWDITFFGKNGLTAHQYLKKGQPVLLDGRVEPDSWVDKATGEKRTKLRVIGDTLTLVGSKNGQEGAPQSPTPRAAAAVGKPRTSAPPTKRPQPAYEAELDPEPDQIPF